MGCNQMGRCKAAWLLVLLLCVCMVLNASAEMDTVTGDHRVCLIRHDSRAKLDNATASQSGGIDYGSQVSLSRCVSACSSDVQCTQTIYDKSKGECYGSKVVTEAVDGKAEGFTTMRCEKAPHLPMTKICRIHSQRGVTPADKPDQLDMKQVKYGEATKTEEDCLMPCSLMEKCRQSTWSIADKKCYPASKAGLMFNQKVGSGGHTIIQCVDQSEETAAESNKAAQAQTHGKETDKNKANTLAADLAKEAAAEKASELQKSKNQAELVAAEQLEASSEIAIAQKALNKAKSQSPVPQKTLQLAEKNLAAAQKTLTDTTAKAAAQKAKLVKAQAAADAAKSKEKALRAKVKTQQTPEEQQAQATADADTEKANSDLSELGKLEAAEKVAFKRIEAAVQRKDDHAFLISSGLEGKELADAKEEEKKAIAELGQAKKVHTEAKEKVALYKVTTAKAKLAAEAANEKSQKAEEGVKKEDIQKAEEGAKDDTQKKEEKETSSKQSTADAQQLERLEASEKDALQKVAAAQEAKDAADKLAASGLEGKELEAAKKAAATAVVTLAQAQKAHGEAKAKTGLFKESIKHSDGEAQDLGKLEAAKKEAVQKEAAAQKAKDAADKRVASGLKGEELEAAKKAAAAAAATLAQAKEAETEAEEKVQNDKASTEKKDEAQEQNGDAQELGKLEATQKEAAQKVAAAQKAKGAATKLAASGLEGEKLEAAKKAAAAAAATLAQAQKAHVEAKAQVGRVKDFFKQRAEAQQAVIKQRNEAQLGKLEANQKVAVQKVAAALKARDAATDHAESGLEGKKLEAARKAVADAVDTLAEAKKAQAEAKSQLGLFKASNPETTLASAQVETADAAKKALEEQKKQEAIAKAVALEKKKELLAAKVEIVDTKKRLQSSQVKIALAKEKLQKATNEKKREMMKIAQAQLAEAQKAHKMHATEYASLLKETKEKKMEAAHAKEKDMKAQQNFETAKRQLALAKRSSEKSNKSDKWYAQGHLLFAQGVKYQGLLQKYETANNKLDAYHYTKELHTFTKAFPQGFTAPLRDEESKPYHSKDIPAGSDSNLLNPGSVVALQGGKLRRFCTSSNAKFTLECNQKKVGENEKFRVVNAGDGKVALKTLTKSTFCGIGGRRKGYQLECNKKTIGKKEKFTVHAAPAGFALQGHTNHYCSDGSTITCRKNHVKRSEMFTAKCITDCD